jgi:hypothetical protein
VMMGWHVRRHRGGAGRGHPATRAARYKAYRGMGSIGAMAAGLRPTATSRSRHRQPECRQAGARGHRGPGALQGLGGGHRLPDGRRPARRPWATAAAPTSPKCASKAEFVRDHRRRHPRKPRARRADHQGSAQLPRPSDATVPGRWDRASGPAFAGSKRPAPAPAVQGRAAPMSFIMRHGADRHGRRSA